MSNNATEYTFNMHTNDEDEGKKKVPEGKQKALDNGWTEKDDWKGEPSDWVDWSIFNMKGDLIGQIKRHEKNEEQLRGRISEMESNFEKLIKFQEETFKTKLEETRKQLKKEKREALKDEDFDKADEIDDELKKVDKKEEELKETKPKESTTKTRTETDAPPQAIVDWYTKHGTNLKSDPDFAEAAEAYSTLYSKRNPGENFDPEKAVKFVDAKLKKDFPQYYGQKRKSNMIEQEDDSPNKGNNKADTGTYKLSDLTDDEKEIAKKMAKTLDITVKEMISQMAKEKVLQIQNGG